LEDFVRDWQSSRGVRHGRRRRVLRTKTGEQFVNDDVLIGSIPHLFSIARHCGFMAEFGFASLF
jgi:hypothetical protein